MLTWPPPLRVSSINALVAALALLLLAASPGAAQNLITNGDFESGAVPNCGQANVPTPWFQILLTADVYSFDCGTLPGVVVGSFNNFTSLTAANDGVRFVAGAHAGALIESFGQTLAAPLTPGATYRLSGAFSVSNSRPLPGVYDIFLSTSTSTAAPDATLLGSVGASATIGSWTPDQFDFVAPANAGIATNLLMVPRSLSGPANSYPGSDSWSLEFLAPPASVPALAPLAQLALLAAFAAIAALKLGRSVGRSSSESR